MTQVTYRARHQGLECSRRRRQSPVLESLRKRDLPYGVDVYHPFYRWSVATVIVRLHGDARNRDYELPSHVRAEYVAEINAELCNGCRQCMRVCQFGAMGTALLTRMLS